MSDDKGGVDRPSNEDVVRSIMDRLPRQDVGAPGQDTVVRASRVTQAWTYRVSGMTWAQVAEQAGYSSAAAAQQALYRAAERVETEAVEDFRRLENDRLDRLQMGVWVRAIGGDLAAVSTVLKVMERRAKLNGLDRPMEVILTPGSADVLAWVSEFLAATGREPVKAGVIEADVVDAEWTETDDRTDP